MHEKVFTYTFTYNGVALFVMISRYFLIDSKKVTNRWLYIFLFGIPLIFLSALVTTKYNVGNIYLILRSYNI
ncbi:hypothetical protein SCHRY_v1c08600 [Spiroplasma chrysopicola DF-1]|uniref:Uncharacterized protein n=1 Tax=Spiroplasma chrysopicola DF-1 TaxID=1276227 RepID=R4U4D8_9MOLU|nr:hypothetical protein SCHRY_v1c08600 [Spiroplasma chrysopicola DF-1]